MKESVKYLLKNEIDTTRFRLEKNEKFTRYMTIIVNFFVNIEQKTPYF